MMRPRTRGIVYCPTGPPQGYLPTVCDEAQAITKHLIDHRVICAAQARCGLDQRIECFLHVEGRPADDLQNIGGGGLLLKGLTELVEQARILDGDHCLGSEVGDQFNLFLSERPDFLAEYRYRTNKSSLLEHRDVQDCSAASKIAHRTNCWISLNVGGGGSQIMDV